MMSPQQFEETLKKYAYLIAKTGVNVQKSHTVVVQIEVEQARLARYIVEACYELGASEVIVKWTDDVVSKLFLTHADEDRLKELPNYRVLEAEDWVDKGASRIAVVSSAPDAYHGVPAQRIAQYQETVGTALRVLRQASQANKISWTVVAAASPNWAKHVFPELSTSEEQVMALWEEIFKTTRVLTDDPILAWEQHDAFLESKAKALNEAQFDALHYRAPGTDLMVGMPKNHIWKGAGSTNARGEKFMANMPTEEVFSAPDARRVNGTVSSTRPLSYGGTIIEGMKFTFKDGEVVEFSAERGEDVLKTLLETDPGSKRLGEVALVPHNSPISESELTFFNTLFDENASNHLAFGSAYAFCVEEGTTMTETELETAGLNRSITHVDFMIGSEAMDIDGILPDGTRVPIFRNGTWAN